MSDAWTLIVGVCGGILAIAGVLSLMWWLVKPRITDYIEEQLARPVRETHHQVTVNHHSSAEPTILDRLDTLSTEVGAQSREFESLHENVANLTEMLVDHLRAQAD